MGDTTRKGEIGEAMVLADLQRKGIRWADAYSYPELDGPSGAPAAPAALAMLVDPSPE